MNQEAREVRMDPEVRDGITGHAPATEGQKYGGNVPIGVKWRELLLLRRIDVLPANGPLQSTAARRKATADRAATRKRAKERAKAEATPQSDDVEP